MKAAERLGPDGIQKDRLQAGAMQDAIRRPPALAGACAGRHAGKRPQRAAVGKRDRFRFIPDAFESGQQPEFDEDARCIRRKLKPGTGFLQCIGLLEDIRPEPLPCKAERSRQPGDAGTDDRNRISLLHGYRAVACAGSGGFSREKAARRDCFRRLQGRIVAVEGRAIGTDFLVLVAHVDEDVRVVERDGSARAHEFLDADLDDPVPAVVLKMGDAVAGHVVLRYMQVLGVDWGVDFAAP